MIPVEEVKAEARSAAFVRRKVAHGALGPDRSEYLTRVLARYRGRPVAGYMPIRTEISPLAAMAQASRYGPVAVPVIECPGLPLRFSRWRPGCALREGPFGAMVPVVDDWIEPEVVIVPLVAFDRAGGRLGYGGGFYDRTLEQLRAKQPDTIAIGFAYSAQQAEGLPLEPTDQPLDMVVTEAGIVAF